jgi:hypothetical protein
MSPFQAWMEGSFCVAQNKSKKIHKRFAVFKITCTFDH